jgi:uncharacterized protein
MSNLVADLRVGRQLIETHISWVFLGTQDVYKVKKPVNLGFLDFTNLSERQRLCEVEVRLNQRLTRGVYHGVVPVVVDDAGKHTFASPNMAAKAVDYAVHMRRLDDNYRLDRLLARGQVSRATVERFAEHLARFHAQCETNHELAQLGSSSAIGKNVEENFMQLGNALATHLPQAQAAALPLMQREFLVQHAPLFAARLESGKVRDGHGDLRLEHVYAEPDGIQVLDCIEFNDRFRYADVCADVAFITMDCRHHRRADLAEALVAAYAAHTGDYQLYPLLNFYESYRAVVRAKVNHIALTEKGVDAPNAAKVSAEIRRYLEQAVEAFRGRERTPRVVVIGGLIASGKSHKAKAVSELLQCPSVATDRVRKQLHHTHAHQTMNTGSFIGAYSDAATEATYTAVLSHALHVLHSGRSVVLDGTFRTAAERRRVVELCQSHGAPLYFVECVADEATLRRRLQTREQRANISDAREPLLDDFMRRYQAPTVDEVGQLCRLDTALPDAEQTRILTHFLNS